MVDCWNWDTGCNTVCTLAIEAGTIVILVRERRHGLLLTSAAVGGCCREHRQTYDMGNEGGMGQCFMVQVGNDGYFGIFFIQFDGPSSFD